MSIKVSGPLYYLHWQVGDTFSIETHNYLDFVGGKIVDRKLIDFLFKWEGERVVVGK